MAFFYIYETVEFPLQLSDTTALEGATKVVVSLKQGKTQLDKINPEMDVETGLISLYLTQEDTAMFKVGKVDLQVNLYYENQERDVTTKAKIDALDNLYRKVITDG